MMLNAETTSRDVSSVLRTRSTFSNETRSRKEANSMVALNRNKIPKIGVGIDFGTGCVAISIFEGGDSQVIQSPIDGPSMPTTVNDSTKKETATKSMT